MGANFSPDMQPYSGQGAFRYWVQTVLPTIYDDSLSYYELLNKVVQVLNAAISDVDAAEANIQALHDAYDELEGYVNNYFDTLDVQSEIDTKLDAMAESGDLEEIFGSDVAAAAVTWLDTYAETHSIDAPLVDDTLSVSGAAADAKVTGNYAKNLSHVLEVESASLTGSFVIGTYTTTSAATATKTIRYNGSIGASTGNIWRYEVSPTYVIDRVIKFPSSSSPSAQNEGVYIYQTGDLKAGEPAFVSYDSSYPSIRVTFKRADGDTVDDDDKTAIANSFKRYRMVDPSLTIKGVPADAEAVGIADTTLSNNIDKVEGYVANQLIVETSAINPMSIGGFTASGTLDNTQTNRVRTPYITRSTTAPLFKFYLDSTDYFIDRMFVYPQNNSTSGAIAIKTSDDSAHSNYVLAHPVSPYYYFRLSFGKNNVSSDYEMTDADITAIYDAFQIYRLTDTSLSVEGAAADAKTTGIWVNNNYVAIGNIVEKIYNTDLQLIYNFHRGEVNTATGVYPTESEDEYHAYYTSVFEDRVISFDTDDIRYRLLYYNGTPSSTTYSGFYTAYVNGTEKTYINATNADRVIVQVESDTTLSAEDIADLVNHLSVKYYTPEDEQTAQEQVKNSRPNPGIVEQVVDICDNWLDNAATAGLTYGNDGILNVSVQTNEIDCSTFVGLILRGYAYTDTSYYTHDWVSPANWSGNTNYIWSLCPRDYYEYASNTSSSKTRVRNTGQLAQWFVKRGEKVLIDEKYANIEVGDVLFFARKDEDTNEWHEPNRYMHINHCAIVVSKERMTSSTTDWDASTYPFKHMIMDVGVENLYYYGTNNKILREYPVAKRVLEAPQHLTNTTLTEDDENSVYTNNINTLVLACRPDFGALAV